ncbi:MAG: GNAT family N-acetyltransferase [Bacilli bacterium]
MEQFYLEVPSIKRKNEVIEYINEFVFYNSDINGTGSLDKILEGYTFEQALERCLNMEKEEYAKKIGRCQSKTFLLIRKNDNRIIGTINVRWNLTEEMKQFGGNIGYGIRPTERRKGYNKINLYLGLIEAKKLGLDKVMLDCDVNNLGSSKTMQALGGTLERTEIDPYDGVLTSVYWFNVDETIDKYREVFKNNIYINKDLINE